uniref:DUF4920 domain-containing protein n=1 Tax=Ningiella ruwaisensis TaxID=2364274 RepID=UPI001F4F9105|nr:DUF4920 domain-containing protein [Ningiella ruwaisensis]
MLKTSAANITKLKMLSLTSISAIFFFSLSQQAYAQEMNQALQQETQQETQQEKIAKDNRNQTSAIRLSEPVETSKDAEIFGATLDETLPVVNLKQLSESPSNYVDKAFMLKTKISKVCQKKGCFFIAQEGDKTIRVAFKDYAFFIPTDSANKLVTLNGTLVKKELSEAQAAHFNQDLQAQTINEKASNPEVNSDDAVTPLSAGVVYEILASSIRIPIVLAAP